MVAKSGWELRSGWTIETWLIAPSRMASGAASKPFLYKADILRTARQPQNGEQEMREQRDAEQDCEGSKNNPGFLWRNSAAAMSAIMAAAFGTMLQRRFQSFINV